MLQNINDKAKGWVAYFIVGFIAIPFALFGIGSYLGGSGSLVAAKVNGEEIPVQEVQNIVLQQRQRMSQIFGGKLPPGFNESTIKQQALEQVVNQTLLRQEAEKYGYRASNQEVYDTISSIPAFQKGGQFDPKTYELLLQSQRRNKSGFEAEVRTSISNQQFPQTINKTAFIPVELISLYQRLQNQVRDAETYTLKKEDYLSQVDVSADEIKKQYDSNAANYMTADKVKLSYVLLEQAEIAKSVVIENDALQIFYENNQSRYTTPEQRRLAHILVKVDEKQDEAKAEEKIKGFYEQINSGSKTFEELASSASDDPLAAKNKGEIGLIARGDMGPLFEKEAFGLNKNELSKVVKTEAGFEIIKLLDVVDSKQKTFDEVKAEVEKLYRNEQAEKLFLEQSDKLQTLAFENESSLDGAADAIGAKVLSSDWIERGMVPDAKNVFTSPEIIAAAFSDDVLTAGRNSELIEIDSATVAVVRLQEHQTPKQKPLADVQDSIKSSLQNQKLRKLLIEKGELALKALRESGEWSALEVIGVSATQVESSSAIKRDNNKLSPSVVDKLFSMQKPGADKRSFDNVILPDGDYVLIALTGVKDGTSDIDSSLQKSFTQMLSTREQAAVLKSLREQAEVELFPENIQ